MGGGLSYQLLHCTNGEIEAQAPKVRCLSPKSCIGHENTTCPGKPPACGLGLGGSRTLEP